MSFTALLNEENLKVKGAAIQASPSSGIPESGPPADAYIAFMYSSICFFCFSLIYS
jgi:hypothetical protein